ncbi:MAG: PepSY domain-containing protein, partial [Muribaculaceae bacterium]|nr:PepSY domain-containing protein [Muribaculaceae bacterium]
VCGVEHTPRGFGQAVSGQAGGDSDSKSGRRGGRHGGGRGSDGSDRHGRGEGRHRRSEFGRWQMVYETLKEQNPDAPQITIGQETASVTISNAGNTRAADKYEFSRRSGEITPATPYAQAVPADKLRGWIYSIHTGGLGGIATRILWLLGALLGASLPLTGYYIWIRHLYKKKDSH